jgi:diguanylate cyclase (GGDEF)-like protein
MPANDLYIVLLVLIAANVVLIAVAAVRSFLRRRRPRAARSVNRAMASGLDGAAISLSPSAISRGQLGPATPEPEPALRSTDRLTGLLKPNEWNRLVEDEDTRHARYRRPATIVMVELDGIDRLVTALGQPAADRVLVAVAGTIQRHARKSDHVARLGTSRFGVLLPETDEVAAINYVERVRLASDLWLESGAISLRLAMGWASPVVDSSLVSAQAQATERMFVEMHRGTLRDRGMEAGATDPVTGLKGAPSAI